MQNFGRGMWRRVGDYERLQKPILLEQIRVEKFIQYQQRLRAHNKIQQNTIKPIILEQKDDITLRQKDDILSEPKDDNIISKQTDDIFVNEDNTMRPIELNTNIEIEENIDSSEFQETNISEPPIVVPKKTKRKNKNKKK